jgi:hypothetical protein
MNGYGGCLVISGKDGSLIHNVPVPTPPAWYRPYSFGSAVSAAGDVNQDGHADFYVSDSESGYNSDPYGVVGSVFLFSGKDASLLGHWNGKWRSWFGRSLLLGPDLDKDGVRELLVGAPGYYSTTLGVIHCLNPRNPQKVNIYNPPSSGYVGYGSCLATMGDYDKDGVPDFYTVAGVQSAYALLGISGASGKVLWEYQDTRPVKDHYVGFFSSGDINGDGPLDLVIGYSPNGWTSPNQIPYYDIWCDSLALRSNERQLSLSGNDTQYFELDAGPAHANAPYLLLGSLSGISPGLPLGRCTLPPQPRPLPALQHHRPQHHAAPRRASASSTRRKGQRPASSRSPACPRASPARALTTPSSPSTARAPPSAATGSRWCSRSEARPANAERGSSPPRRGGRAQRAGPHDAERWRRSADRPRCTGPRSPQLPVRQRRYRGSPAATTFSTSRAVPALLRSGGRHLDPQQRDAPRRQLDLAGHRGSAGPEHARHVFQIRQHGVLAMRITLLVVLLLSIAGSTLAQDLWIRRSPAVNSYFEAVVAVGDIDGDGCSELVKPVRYHASGTTLLRPFDVS